ncbi:MAG: SAM-dependent methyltransferase [Candidatus Pelagibacter sp. TMED64]|nr:SAM-dependent methyltransferase [Candidatus Pelagibacter sp.]OUU67120.1 MAG: SAM-dependent methyltransferase [Candidatus Pelagibacter sp. TMED64]|tara:strand:+ start:2990 stop:3703 length:714 start_codon:yes stop_codon:yes gene_type:complete
MKELKNWDNKTWLSSRAYIKSFNSFILKKKKLNKNSQILDIGCGRGKIFGSLSRKLKLANKPIGVDPVFHKDIDKSLDFRNEDIFKFFKNNQNKFDLIMIKQTLHFFSKDKRKRLIKICKNNLKKGGVLIILSLNTINNEIPCFKLMKQKLNSGLKRDFKMLKLVHKILKNSKIDKFKFKVLITRNNYIKMVKKKYISCLVNLSKEQINNGINEIKYIYPKKILFEDILICIKYKLF